VPKSILDRSVIGEKKKKTNLIEHGKHQIELMAQGRRFNYYNNYTQ